MVVRAAPDLAAAWHGERVRALAARRPGRSLRALARELGVNERTVRDWTSGADAIRGTAPVALELLERATVDPPGDGRTAEEVLGPHVAELVARAIAAGWNGEEVLAALRAILAPKRRQRAP